jgi:hypothetical protein
MNDTNVYPSAVSPNLVRLRGSVLEIDVRGLEPPMPMVQILEAIEELPDGTAIFAQTDRRPEFLLLELINRGFLGESAQQSDGSYITYIRRA